MKADSFRPRHAAFNGPDFGSPSSRVRPTLAGFEPRVGQSDVIGFGEVPAYLQRFNTDPKYLLSIIITYHAHLGSSLAMCHRPSV
jgi:hypothetical protein